MPIAWIPPHVRDLTGSLDRIQTGGATIAQAVDELNKMYPGLRDRLCDGDRLKPGWAVVVNTEVARLGLLTPLGPEDEVHFVPAIGGGEDHTEFIEPRSLLRAHSVPGHDVSSVHVPSPPRECGAPTT